ncbi:DUF924 domain-containing protein [Aestuariibacter sp. AA17]|uniref:DUF924 domain-containing protein n=1 Tax=Fluctibacter corallii TaxID=2984329 RepID=A0ABT3A8R1_9ALTE|nr:DUF924 family protein [Aestuariibacter sp. AA17]MCV2885070.1 DUF924 domain-containing protein [Aestuariibacter sp. AA17]
MSKNEEVVAKILTFWFGELKDGIANPEKSSQWYEASAKFDEEVTSHFHADYQKAKLGKLDDLAEHPRGALALIILLDQMPRNMFRGKAEAFETDLHALQICLAGLEAKFDKQLAFAERLFFYHPLEHAESLEHQQLCVELMADLMNEHKGNKRDIAKVALKFALSHRNIIEEFGRFPHRNAVLNRQSTSSELFYLAEGGDRFGQ